MSNCVEVQEILRVPSADLLPTFWAELDAVGRRAKELIDAGQHDHRVPRFGDDAAGRRQATVWWFLVGVARRVRDSVYINLGEGQSTHTFRDLRQTLAVIGNHIGRHTTYRLLVSDVGDGGMYRMKCEFRGDGSSVIDGFEFPSERR